jgi:cytochrome c oxidase subunit I+III
MTTAEIRLTELWKTEPGFKGWFGTVDHKKLGKRYLMTAFAFLVLGGIEALIVRLQLARADQRLVTPEAYDQIFTMHGMTMIFWYALPILSGFGNYLIPLMLGARDMAFPRLNAFSYWVFLMSGGLLYVSPLLGQAPHAGWFAYVPYTTEQYSPGLGMDFYALTLIFLTVSTTVGAINFIVTILRHRAEGMSVSKMPLLMYSTMTISFSIVFALPALTAACLFLELDRRWGFHFYDVSRGGSALLWQQLFWFFGHPWVYIIFLPATGMVSMLLPVFSRRPIVAYPYVALATVLTGVVGFGVWVHHMFATGIGMMGMSFFSAASMTISIFSAVQVFAWIATIWTGRPVLTASMLFALGFISALVIGGLSGIVTAVIPFDWQLTDTYFVVAHLHYVLVGANVFPVFAAFYYWLPKMTGRMMSERLGKWSFWLMLVGFNLAFFPMHFTGLRGMPRRVFTYPIGKGWENLNLAATIGAGILTIGILISLWNLVLSLRKGAPAGANPWNADTLEWSTLSPPEVYGSVHLPSVKTRHPLWDRHVEEEDPRGERVFDDRRVTLSTSWLEARPAAVAKMPKDTTTPFFASLVLTGVFAALLVPSVALAAVAGAGTLLVLAVWQWPEREKHPPVPAAEPRNQLVTQPDGERGALGMWLFIATEALLFVMLFFTYFYLGPYPTQEPPKLRLALPMLAILLLSSAVLWWAERRVKSEEIGKARAGVLITVALGITFLVLQLFEYRDHLKTLAPQSNAYGSIFYALTGVHGLHVLLGTLMLGFVGVLPRLEPTDRPPRRPVEVVARYWHFVDLIWVLIVGILYVWPNFSR